MLKSLYLKLQRWGTTIVAIIGAVALVLYGAKVVNRKQRAEKAEKLAENIIQDHTKASLDKAEALQIAAANDKKAAEDAKAKMEKQLEALGKHNEAIDDIADRFNSRRLRKPADTDPAVGVGSTS